MHTNTLFLIISGGLKTPLMLFHGYTLAPKVRCPGLFEFFHLTDWKVRPRVIKPRIGAHTAVRGKTELGLGLQASGRDRTLPKARNYDSAT